MSSITNPITCMGSSTDFNAQMVVILTDLDDLEWRIVGYLSPRRRNMSNSFDGHVENTQPAIASAMNKVRSLCSLKLASLMERGYVQTAKLHTANARRRRNVYYLTDDGYRLFEGRLKQSDSRASDRKPTWSWNVDSNTWVVPPDE